MINFGIWAWKWLCMGYVGAYLRLACADFRAVIYKNEYELHGVEMSRLSLKIWGYGGNYPIVV